MSLPKIQDEFTDLPVSKQRKWQLRHPEKNREIRKRWAQSPAGRASKKRSFKKWREKVGRK